MGNPGGNSPSSAAHDETCFSSVVSVEAGVMVPDSAVVCCIESYISGQTGSVPSQYKRARPLNPDHRLGQGVNECGRDFSPTTLGSAGGGLVDACGMQQK